jgi:hypothetical protein
MCSIEARLAPTLLLLRKHSAGAPAIRSNSAVSHDIIRLYHQLLKVEPLNGGFSVGDTMTILVAEGRSMCGQAYQVVQTAWVDIDRCQLGCRVPLSREAVDADRCRTCGKPVTARNRVPDRQFSTIGRLICRSAALRHRRPRGRL